MDDATRGLLARALAVLRELQWSTGARGRDVCPWCGDRACDGHADDCALKRTMDELAAAIGEGDEERR